ncbi:MAG: YceI family protein [Pseudomonadota bacterium]
MTLMPFLTIPSFLPLSARAPSLGVTTRLVLLIGLVVLMIAPAALGQANTPETGEDASAPEWIVQADRSAITFTFEEQGRTVDGSLAYFDAVIAFDPSHLDLSQAEVSVPIAAIDANDRQRNEILRGPLWFDAVNYPEVTYSVTRFDLDDQGTFFAYGDLMIRETRRPVTLTFELTLKGDTAQMVGQAQISRKAFGLGTGEWADESLVGDQVDIHVTMHAKRQAAPAS